MLIDALHPEETRVVVVRGSKVEEFDFESANRKQLRGNIYLAKVTRVEPSLQAAFVEYGGNRQGFLAFNEIHPDYYQIPVADREALLEEYARAEFLSEHDDEKRSHKKKNIAKKAAKTHDVSTEIVDEKSAETTDYVDTGYEVSDLEPPQEAKSKAFHGIPGTLEEAEPIDIDSTEDVEGIIEQIGGGGDALDDVPERPRHYRRQYKIQEVIKRRQLLLVQVVKEERGNKGAALTTYLSLAGRYSVLMPNTGRGGGISRKITNTQDRKRLKEIAHDLEVPAGMGVILRTAGATRTKTEIKRDFEYLMRLWLNVRELTMESSAPLLVYEEGSLIKRAIRDLYNKDIGEILVSGDNAYREAKDFMRMLMPSHARFVQPYKEPVPIFAHYNVESQLDAMFSNQVQLKSGGYLVINPTEALVSIDVNSGRSTKEHNIEDTAIRTNLEAAEEVSRQLRLRDLAGLIVIDFIDMEEKRNNRSVEKRLAECLKSDRARIQVGRISPFGLLEMSRQRIRTGVLESSSVPCPHCAGTGFLRSTPSSALQVLRAIEENLIQNSSHNLIVHTKTDTAFYILNQKRNILQELENRFVVSISIEADDHLVNGISFSIERGELAVKNVIKAPSTNIHVDSVVPQSELEIAKNAVGQMSEDENPQSLRDTVVGAVINDVDPENANRRRKRRRRGRNGRRDRSAFHDTSVAMETAVEKHLSSTDDIPVIDSIAAEEVQEKVVSVAVDEGKKEEVVVETPDTDIRKERASRTTKKQSSTRRSRKINTAEEQNTSDISSESSSSQAPAQDEEPPKPEKEAAKKTKSVKTEKTGKKQTTSKKGAVAKEVSDVSEEKKTDKEEKKAVKTKSRSVKLDKPSAQLDETKETQKTTRAQSKAKKDDAEAETKVKPKAKAKSRAEKVSDQKTVTSEEPVSVVLTPQDPERPKRAGWWSRKT